MGNIYIHSGSAHADELFAVVILWLLQPKTLFYNIHRVAQIPENVCKDDWVLDVGMEFDPIRHRYDHHQAGAPEGLCAAGLLLRELDPGFFEFLMRDPFPGVPSWFRTLNYVDTKGPYAFKKAYGALTPDFLGPAITAMAERNEVREAAHLMLPLLQEWQLKFEAVAVIDAEAALLPMGFHTVGGVDVVFIPSADPRHTAAIARRLNWEEADPGVVVSFDDRNEGLCLFRRGDHPLINFAVLEGNPKIRFAHEKGFVCKTMTRIPEEEWLELLTMAISPASTEQGIFLALQPVSEEAQKAWLDATLSPLAKGEEIDPRN